MGKANKAKSDLLETADLSYLVQTLKDVADNKYHTLVNHKDTFKRFGESFVEFFRLINLTTIDHPLITNDNPQVGFVVVNIDGTFLSGFNNKIIDMAIAEAAEHQNVRFITVGCKVLERIKQLDPDAKVFPPMEENGMYETAVMIKDYLIEEVMNDRLGKVKVFYSWPKSFEIQRQRKVNLLPCTDLISKQVESVEVIENVIEESEPIDVIAYLSNLWTVTRLYEMFVDTNIASAAAQANLLEESTKRMKKEHKNSLINYRKARKLDIDKGLRETFSGQMMTKN